MPPFQIKSSPRSGARADFRDLSRSLDKIFASPELNLRDHLSLAASCKSFRACYYTLKKSNTPKKMNNLLWEALIVLRPPASTSTSRVTAPPSAPTADHHRLIKHIFTNEDKVGLDEMRVLWPKARGGAVEPKRTGRTQAEKREAAKEQVPGGAMRSVEWEEAIDLVHNTRVTATEAMKTYKLSKKELEPLPHLSRPNPHGGRSSGPMRLFVEATVESRALRLHGGVWGHEQL